MFGMNSRRRERNQEIKNRKQDKKNSICCVGKSMAVQSRTLGALVSTLQSLRNHKKKSIFVLFIAACYLTWKLRDRIPYQRILQKIMAKIMAAMDKQMKHQQFMESQTITLNACLSEFDKSTLLCGLPGKYNGMFEIRKCRNELRNKAKELSKDRKTEIWQKLIDEVILFVLFSLIVTRQRITVEMLKKTLIAKYKSNLAGVLGEDEFEAQILLETMLDTYFNKVFDEKNVLEFLRSNLVHNIKPTTQMDYFEVKKSLTELLTSCAFTTSQQRKQPQGTKKSLKKTTKKNNDQKDKKMAKIFWETSDPTYETPSLMSRIFNCVKKLGQFVFPNMYPESQHLSPPGRKYKLIQLMYGMYQEGVISDLENSIVIGEVFKERAKRQREQQEEESAFGLENNEEKNDQSSLGNSRNNNKKPNDTSDETSSSSSTLQAKFLCNLILKELRDIIDMSSMNIYFYYSCLFDLRKFLNRLLLLLHKKQELHIKQPFAKYSVYLDKLILEEFLKADAEANNQGFYDVRIKKCFGLIKSQHTRQQQQQQQQQLCITHSQTSNATQEALELSSSGENNLLHSSSESSSIEPLEYLINLNVLQEIEQHQIVEEALKEMIKRIFFEREQSTVSIEPTKKQSNEEAQKNGAAGGSQGLGQLFNMLSGGAPGQEAGGDIMQLLSRV